jgi:DNA-binding NtrC family response regulator
VGESAPIKVDARVVAATNKDLMEAVKAGRFREDLFYRLNVVTIRIPPLRERREDVPLLAEHFASRHAGARGASLTTEAREALLAWDWPGNVRELENAVARALALNPGGTILPEDLPEQVRERGATKRAAAPKTNPPPAQAAPPAADPLLADRPTLDELNRRYAERMLKELGGNKTKTAEALGIDRKTLSRILREE